MRFGVMLDTMMGIVTTTVLSYMLYLGCIRRRV